MEHGHSPEAIRARIAEGPKKSYLGDWIYGGVDGAITIFAIVSSAVGAELSSKVIVILGLGNLVADGLAMAAANFLATRSEREELDLATATERRHIAVVPEGERAEVREIFRQYGLDGELLERVVTAVTANRDQWVKFMLRDEYGLSPAARSPWAAASSTFLAFLSGGTVPLVPFVVHLRNAAWLASGLTGLTFVVIGAMKSKWSPRAWWLSSLETLVIGTVAASVAYAIGALLRSSVGS